MIVSTPQTKVRVIKRALRTDDLRLSTDIDNPRL